MKLIIDIPDAIMDYLRNNGCLSVIYTDEVAKAIIYGTPYDEKVEKIIDMLETEWGYEGIREDVARIMRGGEK